MDEDHEAFLAWQQSAQAQQSQDWIDRNLGYLAAQIIFKAGWHKSEERFKPTSVHFCPIHGTALCPEIYMLASEGAPWPQYAAVWKESMRCGKAVKLYRKEDQHHEPQTEGSQQSIGASTGMAGRQRGEVRATAWRCSAMGLFSVEHCSDG